MKVLVPIIIIAAVVAGIVYFNKTQVSGPEASMTNVPAPSGEAVAKDFEGTFVFDTQKSSATWTGSKKIIQNYYDSGSIAVHSGNVIFSEGTISGGEVVFDMTSISAKKTGKGDGEENLSKHLKSEDFFEVETYPEAKYTISSAKEEKDGFMLVGDLTLKGETHPLSVFVKTAMENGNVLIAGVAEVNRATWNVRFGSETFFDNLGDNVIHDIFTLEFNIVAKP